MACPDPGSVACPDPSAVSDSGPRPVLNPEPGPVPERGAVVLSVPAASPDGAAADSEALARAPVEVPLSSAECSPVPDRSPPVRVPTPGWGMGATDHEVTGSSSSPDGSR
ncbi:hypothetical protein Krhi01_01439 [Kocuria rhizophila]